MSLKSPKSAALGQLTSSFRNFLGRMSSEEDTAFDCICHKMNTHLVQLFGCCMSIHKSNKAEAGRVRFNEGIIKFLQSREFSNIVESGLIPEFQCHPGMVIIVQSLWKNLLEMVRNQLPTRTVESSDFANRKVNFKVEVNSFFGWAILEVHRLLLSKLEDDFNDRRELTLLVRFDILNMKRHSIHLT
jgi:hypothetical protein